MTKLTKEEVAGLNDFSMRNPTVHDTEEQCQIGCGNVRMIYHTLIDMDRKKDKVGGFMCCPKCGGGYPIVDVDDKIKELESDGKI